MKYIEKYDSLIDERNVKPELRQSYEEIRNILLREDTVEQVTEKAPFNNTYYCPICNNHVESGSVYCPSCASKLGWKLLWDEN